MPSGVRVQLPPSARGTRPLSRFRRDDHSCRAQKHAAPRFVIFQLDLLPPILGGIGTTGDHRVRRMEVVPREGHVDEVLLRHNIGEFERVVEAGQDLVVGRSVLVPLSLRGLVHGEPLIEVVSHLVLELLPDWRHQVVKDELLGEAVEREHGEHGHGGV